MNKELEKLIKDCKKQKAEILEYICSNDENSQSKAKIRFIDSKIVSIVEYNKDEEWEIVELEVCIEGVKYKV